MVGAAVFSFLHTDVSATAASALTGDCPCAHLRSVRSFTPKRRDRLDTPPAAKATLRQSAGSLIGGDMPSPYGRHARLSTRGAKAGQIKGTALTSSGTTRNASRCVLITL